MKITKKEIIKSLVVCLGLVAQNSYAATVYPDGGLVDLGYFAAGSYLITGSGTVDLMGDGTFTMNPDGLPVSVVTAPNYYSYFNPSGSYTADGDYGPAGTNAKIGALIGTLSSTPSGWNDWFLIGYQTQVTLSSASHIYASVNDTYYPNDTGFFEVNVSPVPVPAAVWLFGSGLVGLVGFNRKRSQSSLS
jgi:hypothetical protein